MTGEGEREHLPKLFVSLAETRACHFEVVRKVEQLSPRRERSKNLKLAGLPTRDEELGLAVRGYLSRGPDHFALVVDDLEFDRRDVERETFGRYRQALDTVLSDTQRDRASVHFLVYMLEAYYFAHADATNTALDLSPGIEDFVGDVETIRHPKNELKKIAPNFRERSAAQAVLELLDVRYVLSNEATCTGLRTMFVWCLEKLMQFGPDWVPEFSPEVYRRTDGRLRDSTRGQ